MSAISGPVTTEAAALPPASHRWIRAAVIWAAPALIVGAVAGALAAHWYGAPRTAANAPSSLRFLTYSGHDSSPSVSPDGHTVAFMSDRDGTPRIWVKQLTGGGEVALTTGRDDFPRFSPDGSNILFARNDGRHMDLYRTTALGGDPRKIIDDATDGDWSPDGRRIAFLRWKSQRGRTSTVFGIVGLNGDDVLEVAEVKDQGLFHPRWSPDGQSIAAVASLTQGGSRQPIYILNFNSKEVHRVLTPGLGVLSSVWWADAGRAVIYSQCESVMGGLTGSSARVIRHDLKSGSTQPLFFTPQGGLVFDGLGAGRAVFDTRSPRVNLREYVLHGGAVQGTYRWMTRGNSNDRQPVYGQKSEWIMFSSNRSGGKLDLWELSNTTGAVKRVTDNDAEDWDPAFMPDGRKILWSSNRSGNFEIWTAEPDGSSPRQVSHDGADAENPTATPDGWVVYASGNPEKMGLWKVRLDGSSAARILPGNLYYGEVSPDGKYAAYVIPNASDQYLLEVVRVADGQVLPFQVPLPIVNQAISASIGRPRWMPGGRAIAFVGQDEKGVSGIFVQDFIPDQNTSATLRPLAGFDPEFATESFAISPDGNRMMIASWEQLFNLMLVENAPGVTRAK